MPDLATDLVDTVLRELGVDADPDARLRAETAIRIGWGGERHGFRKKPPKAQRYRAIRADLDAGLTYREAAARHGCSLRTAKRAGKHVGPDE